MRIARRAVIALLLAVLTAAVPLPSSAVTATAVVLSTSNTEIWPNPVDGGAPTETTITYRIDQSATYTLWVVRRGGLIVREQPLPDQTASDEIHSWTWDGHDEDGEPAPRGEYRIQVLRQVSEGTYHQDTSKSALITVHNGTDIHYQPDRLREPGTKHVNLSWFTIVNSAATLVVEFDFKSRARRYLSGATAALDVNNARRGYLLTVARKDGRFKTTLALAILGSDSDYHRRVRCPGLESTVRPKRVSVTVPRSCMTVGGRSVRANYWAHDRHHHADYGPDGGTYFTRWVTYQPPIG